MRRLSPRLKREIQALVFLIEDAMPDCGLPVGVGDRPTFEEQLARIERLPVEVAGYDLARPLFHWFEADAGGPERLADPATRKAVLERAERAGEDTRAAAELIFTDPVELRRRFVDLLSRYWDEAFELEWGRLEPRLVAEIEDAGKRIARDGLYDTLDRHPGLHVDREEGVLIRRSPHEHEVVLTPENPLMLVPSAYVWPHVRVNCDPPWPLALVYAARFARIELEQPPDGLVQAFRALGDATRLRALRLIAERPRSTEELATLVGLSESGLSKHLRVLSDAGLVTTKRQGYYVLYALNRDTIGQLPGELGVFVHDRNG
jgi:DNA-binding transcriptional ArsR family regulator